jgi:hypothetical protein
MIVLSSASSKLLCAFGHSFFHTIQAVLGHFIPGWSDIVCGIHNVVVFPKLPDGLFIFTICFLCKLLVCAAEVVGLKIQYYFLIHWLYMKWCYVDGKPLLKDFQFLCI